LYKIPFNNQVSEKTMKRIDLSSGIIAAPIMPFHNDGSPDWKTLEHYIYQVGAGQPRAIAMNMALSEGSSLELQEQLEVIRRCKQVLEGGCHLLSGINANHTAGAIVLARKLVEAGADGLVVFPPVPAFYGPLPLEMIAAYHRDIANSVDVPLLAFQTSFVSYPPGSIKILSEIPGIVGIKDASFDVDQTLQNVKEGATLSRKIAILTGSDTFILEAILMGCDGALIGFASTATAALVQMHEFARKGKITEAYEIWNALAPLARIGWRQPRRDYRVRMKYVLMKQGIITNMTVRAPLPALSEADRHDIDETFKKFRLVDPRFFPAGRAIENAHLMAGN
jgi:4-hydroxy-tetrahydrodipicolinate synthase